MAENKAQIVVDGDVSPLRQALREAGRDLKKFGDDGKSSVDGLGGAFAGLQSKFLAIGALLAGGAVFRQAVSEAASFTEQSIQMGRALGISATEAGKLKLVLEDNETSIDEFVGAAQKLLRQVNKNEEGINKMGLATRDASGELRPLNELTLDAIDVLNGYKAGTDRAVAAQALFGKGVDISTNLLKLNKQASQETIEFAEKLGLVVGGDNVEAFADYDDAMDKSHLVMKAVKTTIGNALMPVLSKLGEWFASIGPSAIVVIRGAVGGLISVFWGLKTAVSIVFNLMNASVVQIAEPIRALGAAFIKLLKGDLSGAKAEIANIPKVWNAAWSGAFSNIVADATEARDKMYALFAEGAPSAKPGKGGKGAEDLLGKDKKDKSKTKQDKPFDEEDFRQDQMRDANAQADKELDALRRAAEKELEIRRKVVLQTLQIKLLQADGMRSAEMARIDELAANSQYEVELGQIAQAQHLANLAVFNQQRLAAEQLFIDQKKELALQDPDQNPVELERIELEKQEIRRRYAAEGMDIQRQQSLESQGIWQELTDVISGLWDKGIQALMNGTLTWKNAFQAIGADLTQWFVTNVVGKMVKEFLAGEAAKIAGKMGWIAIEKALNLLSAKTTIGTKGTETVAVTGMNAAQAGTGAGAAMASIPYIGPILAIAAMASIFAAVSAMGKRRSAAGGYDIPRGLNPMTQLHTEEMVLPAHLANAVRGMTKKGGAGDGGEGGGSQPMVVNISATDARGVRDLLLNNQQALVEALKSAQRNFER